MSGPHVFISYSHGSLSYMRKNVAIGNNWPPVDEPWFRAVQDAAVALEQEDMPDSIRTGTKNLFMHALLQNAGVERRKAIDTLRAGGLVEPVAHNLARLLRDARTEPWVRVRASFALGFMQVRDHRTRAELVSACTRAFDGVARARLSRAQIVELQTALFAVGDVFGVTGAEDHDVLELAGEVRGSLALILTELVNKGLTTDPVRFPIARAIAYLLTFTAQPGQHDLSPTLFTNLREHPDRVTRRFSDWALSFRFADDHSIRPLLCAIQ